MRVGAARIPLLAETQASAQPREQPVTEATSLPIDPAAFAAAAEAYELEQEAAKQAKREAKERLKVLEKAASVAARVGLGSAEEARLGDLMLAEREKRRAIETEADARGPSRLTKEWKDAERAALEAWAEDELELRLGATLAGEIRALRRGKKRGGV